MTIKSRSNAALEARLRRLAIKQGFVLRKSRRHLGTPSNFGEFMLIHADTNCIVAGCDFDLPLTEVESVLAT